MAGHALALEHASRRLALTDGTRRAVRHRVAVSLHAARKIVALHGAGEALAHRGPGDIDDLTRGEHVDFQLGAGCQSVALALVQAEFLGGIAGGDIGLGEMARQRLGNPRWAAAASSDLHRAIAVGFVTFDLRDAVRQRLDDRHGDSHTGVGEYSGHAALAANQTNGHCQNPQAGSFDWLPQSLQSAGGLGNGPQLPLGNWRRAHALRPLKLDGGLYMNSPAVQVSVRKGPGDRKP